MGIIIKLLEPNYLAQATELWNQKIKGLSLL